MAILTEQIKEFVNKQKLGYAATVCPDGTPNLSPKGSTIVWDDDHIVFADVHSPGTIGNLLHNPSIEINVVDIFTRKGYRFKGKAIVHSAGNFFDEVVTHYKAGGSQLAIKNIVAVKVERVLEVTSPAYDRGLTETEIKKRWTDYWRFLFQ